MSDDTISKIKLRLNNNLRSIQSKSTRVAALSNRMSATDYAPCNDFFANCCNCCGPGCNCCPCLSGFFIIISGWEDGTNCTCTTLNGGPVWAPRHTLDIDPTKTCDQNGQVPGFQTFGSYDCHPSKKNTSLEWSVFCQNGKLYLSVVTNSNLVYSLGGSLSVGVVAELLVEVEDCDSLAVDEVVACQVGAGSPDCICPSGIRIQTFPVFGVQLPEPYPPLPNDCLCCPARCGALDPECLNPIAPILTITIVDTCGTRTFTLTSLNTDPNVPNTNWQGIDGLICCEQNYSFHADVNLTCIEGDSFAIDYDLDYGAGIRSFTFILNEVSCDPFSVVTLDTPQCGELTNSSCIPDTYCIYSITITE